MLSDILDLDQNDGQQVRISHYLPLSFSPRDVSLTLVHKEGLACTRTHTYISKPILLYFDLSKEV